MEEASSAERQLVEIELLQAMYPDQMNFDIRSSELRYTGTPGGTLVLRIPSSYPEHSLPELISANDASKDDVRTKVKAVLDDMQMLHGEELLDAVIQGFEKILTTDVKTNNVSSSARLHKEGPDAGHRYKTVIVWLHHLLNTNKRKLALSPSKVDTASDGGIVSGITKPGYPGVLVYSGRADLVDAHVAELKQQRWQAFQVRYEEEHDEAALWKFTHGVTIREVESMSDVAQAIVDENKRGDFLASVGIK